MPGNRHEDEFDRELEGWAAARPDAQVSPETRIRIHNKLSASLVPVNPIPSVKSLTLILFLVFAVCAGSLITIGDKAGFRLMTGRQMLIMAAVLVAGGVIFSFSLACRMVPGSRPGFPMALALMFWGAGMIGGIALLFPWRNSTAFVSEGWPCAVTELSIALSAAALFWVLAQRGALFPDADLGAALVGLSSALALLVLQFRCMFQNVLHLFVWHVLTAAVLIGTGALAARFYRGRRIH